MGNTIKRIKTIVLLVALSCCWQNNAMAAQDDVMEVEGEAGRIKRSAQQADLSQRESSEGNYKNFPYEIIDNFYYSIKHDQNTLVALSSSCKTFHTIAMQKYIVANAAEHHFPWVANPSLTPRTLNILNTRMLMALGLYVNIKNDWATKDIDYRRFEKLCAQFEENPLFPSTAVPVMYVEFLELDLKCPKPPPFQAQLVHPLQPEWLEKRENYINALDTIAQPENPICQNERCLYFHFYQFVEPLPSDQLKSRRVDPAFVMLNNSLKTVLNEDLFNLKKTPGLSDGGEFSETWKAIIELEPAATDYQLDLAARSCGAFADEVEDEEVGEATITRAIEYSLERLRIIKSAGLSPTAVDYNNLALTCFEAGNKFRDPLISSAYFVKSAQYHKEQFKAITADGQRSTTRIDYDSIAFAYLESARCTTDALVRHKSCAKAIKYSEKHLSAIVAAGQYPTSYDHNNIAKVYFFAGVNAQNPFVRAINFKEATVHLEYILKEGKSFVNAAHQLLKEIAAHNEPFEQELHIEYVDDPSLAG